MKTILITILRLFTSCPGIFTISGKVISDKTEIPIEAAQIELLDIKHKLQQESFFFSDKDGKFTASSVMRKMLFGLPTYQMTITKSGYQNLEITLNLTGNKESNLYRLLEN